MQCVLSLLLIVSASVHTNSFRHRSTRNVEHVYSNDRGISIAIVFPSSARVASNATTIILSTAPPIATNSTTPATTTAVPVVSNTTATTTSISVAIAPTTTVTAAPVAADAPVQSATAAEGVLVVEGSGSDPVMESLPAVAPAPAEMQLTASASPSAPSPPNSK